MIRKIIYALLSILLLLAIINWDLITYGIGQAKGQLTIITSAKDINELLVDDEFPDSLKQKIRIIEEVRIYAVDFVGLNNSENYTTFYDQKGETALWNLSACEPFSFTPKTWSFPILGSFPYKGYFDLDKAIAEQELLKKQNFDTRIRAVGGWSTLGWFSDPILSNMLDRSEGRLADLIIHELTHSTLFIKDDIQFNENLASFIGQIGAVNFLESKYGKGSYEVEDYLMQNEDGSTFTNQMLLGAHLLDSLYLSFAEADNESDKKIKKDSLINQIVLSLDTIHFHNDRYYKIFENGPPNNAYFMSFLRYHSVEDSLQDLLTLRYNGDLKKFIQGMIEEHQD